MFQIFFVISFRGIIGGVRDVLAGLGDPHLFDAQGKETRSAVLLCDHGGGKPRGESWRPEKG